VAWVWAISPATESSWPADEHAHIEGKLVALQMKRPHIAPLKCKPIDFSQLGWWLGDPRGQYDLVKNFKEVFYCLPTFINRRYRRESLHHCIFWRPEDDARAYKAWYNNPRARTVHKSLILHPNSYRWGQFLEAIQSCDVGRVVRSAREIEEYVKKIVDAHKQRQLMAPRERIPPEYDEPTDGSSAQARPESDSGDSELVRPFYMVYMALA